MSRLPVWQSPKKLDSRRTSNAASTASILSSDEPFPEPDKSTAGRLRAESFGSRRRTARPICRSLRAWLPDGAWPSKDDGFDRCSVVERCVLAKCFKTGGDDGAVLRDVEEDVSRYARGALEPVRLVKCSAIDAKYVGKSFEIQKQLGAAGRAEIDGDPLSASFRREGISNGLAGKDFKISSC